LVCNWLHFVGQNYFYVMIHLYREVALSRIYTVRISRRLCADFSNTFECHLVFDQLWDFFPKHKYGKTAAIVWTMWIPVQTCSFIRQVEHSNFRRPDDSLHDPDTRASYMEIACIRSIVQTIDAMVLTCQALIWILQQLKCDCPDARATPSGCGSIQERISANFGKLIAQLSVQTPYVYCPDSAQVFQARLSFEPVAYK